ncbi:MAG: hypothetical protein JWM80_3859 [Cyanobacteria bacterium RYN_339]|nr:hypothetical protein [Cyanobacteria bacterium RYN_339]
MSYCRPASQPLSIVVADPGGGDRLLATLRAMRDARQALPCELIGVVGGQDVGVVPLLRQEFPLVHLYQAWGERDLGSLYGIGARAAGGRFLLLLDGSARVDADAVFEMMAFMEQGTFIALVAPRLRTPSGGDLSPGRPFPTVGTTVAEFEGKAATIQAGPRLQHALDRRITTPKEVEAVTGGCCLVKKQAIDELGAFAKGYPPGGEILDWCRRARQGGWAVFYHPGLTAQLVAEEQESPRSTATRLKASSRFLRRHRGLAAVLALDLALALPILLGLLLGGSGALIPGAHRTGALFTFWRSWYAAGVLVLG